ncbi:MAG: pitrilysin family protein [bacterium]|nr:pitrilysin family protein [bacterium]
MYQISTLKNGLRIITNKATGSRSVGIAVFVGAGGRYETENYNGGVAHYLEHVLFKGSKKRPTPKKIAETIDRVGGDMNAYTAEDHTCYYVKLPKKHLHLGFDVLADNMINPLFKNDEIERERGVIIEEMNVYKDNPARYVFDLVGELMWPYDKLKTNVIGREEIIEKIPKKRIISYYNALYTVDNMVVSVSGNVEHEEIVKLVKSKFARQKTKAKMSFEKVKGSIAKNKSKLFFKDTNQAHFVICCRSVKLNTKNQIAFELLSTILGGGMSSRLFLNVREKKGLAYTIFAHNSGFVDSGKFEIYAGVNKNKVKEALRATMLEIKKIKNKPVSNRELDKAKEQVKGRLIMSQEDNGSVADRMGEQIILLDKADTVEKTLKKIDKITSEDIQKIADKYFRSKNFRLAVIGPFDENQQAEFENLIKI